MSLCVTRTNNAGMVEYLNDKGRVIRISPSAASKYMDCPRQWWYAYKERRPQVFKASRDTGKKVHAHVEHFGKHGEWKAPEADGFGADNPLLIAQQAEPYLPAVRPGVGYVGNVDIEYKFDKVMCGPLPFIGFTDIGQADPDRVAIVDIKTTKSKEFRWSKTEQQLREDKQMGSYAYCYITMRGLDVPAVTLQHINLCVTPSGNQPDGTPIYQAMPVSVTIPVAEVYAIWNEMETIAEGMVGVLKTATGPEDVPAETSSCRKYGGCDYANVCPASPKNRHKAPEQPPVPLALLPKGSPMSTAATSAARSRYLPKAATAQDPAPPASATASPPAANDAVSNFAETLRSTIANGVPINAKAGEMMCNGQGLDYKTVLAAAGLTEDNGLLVLAGSAAAPATPEPPAPVRGEPLSEAALLDVVSALDASKVAALRSGEASNFLVATELMNEDGTYTDRGKQVLATLGPAPETPPPAEQAASPALKADPPETSAEPLTDEQLATQLGAFLQEQLEGDTTVLPRKKVDDFVKATDPEVKRLRVERLERLLGILGNGWVNDRASRKVMYKGTPANTEPPANVGEQPAYAQELSRDEVKAFMREEGTGTREASVKAWLKGKGYGEDQLPRLLAIAGSKILHGILVPMNWEGDARAAYTAFNPDALSMLERLDEQEKVIFGETGAVSEPAGDLNKVRIAELEKRLEQADARNQQDIKTIVTLQEMLAEQGTDTTAAESPVELFIGCYPVSGGTAFVDFITPAISASEQAGGTVNKQWKQPLDHWNELDFNGGSKAVAAILAKTLKTDAGQQYVRDHSPIILPPEGHPLAGDCIPVLARFVPGIRILRAG